MNKSVEMISPAQIIEIVLRRRWLILIPFCLSMMAGIFLVIVLPKIYKASTLILIQPQKVPDEFVRSIVSTDIDSRINTISQQIMSRSNLEKVITEFNLFKGEEQQNVFMEDKIRKMRSWISVKLIRENRRGPADAFSISFKGQDPRLVMRVTNALATYFIDENLRVREAQALGTSDFLDDELREIRSKLEAQEEALKNYRARYMGGLPEQLQTNLRILEGLQLQLNMKNESMRYAKNNLIMIEKQLESQAAQVGGMEEMPALALLPEKSADELQLDQLKKEQADLELSYTERHPDIIRIKKKIQDLSLRIGQTSQDESPEADIRTNVAAGNDISNQRQLPALQNELTQRRLQRDEFKFQIATLNSEVKDIESQLAYYQRMVENTPKREQELLSLNRDYENIKESYDSLLARKLESDIAVNMEKKQKGEQFRVIDPAKLPQRPIEPDMKKLFILVIGAGLGIGGGIIFLLEYLDSSFRKPEELESILELPVMCTIPRLFQQKEMRLQRLNQVFSILFAGVSLVLFAGFTVLALKGVDQTIDIARNIVNM